MFVCACVYISLLHSVEYATETPVICFITLLAPLWVMERWWRGYLQLIWKFKKYDIIHCLVSAYMYLKYVTIVILIENYYSVFLFHLPGNENEPEKRTLLKEVMAKKNLILNY